MSQKSDQTQFLKALWDLAPEVSYPNVFDKENIDFLFIIVLCLLGSIMRDSGAHLSKRIKRVKQRAQDRAWERSLTPGQVESNLLNIEINTESKDSWYKRPIGIITLTLISGYLVNLLSNLSGIQSPFRTYRVSK